MSMTMPSAGLTEPAMTGNAQRLTGAWKAAAFALPLAAALFNCVLCFLATRGMNVGVPLIAGTEVLIVGLSLVLPWRFALETLLVPGVLVALNLIALGLLASGLDSKIAIDLAIPAGFFVLGRQAGGGGSARALLLWAAAITLAVGLYEMFALPSFEHWFHVYDYYVGKGALEAAHAGDTGTLLAENGVRPEDQGRQLLGGFLGLHRVGSIFLEPVSAGNFGAICAAFVLATRDWRWRGLVLAAMGVAIGVLADARFSILSAVAIAGFLATPLWRSRVLVASLPVICVIGLMVLGGVSHSDVDNSVVGRLTGSGQLLDSWSIWQWLGAVPDRATSMDTGYSYVIGNLGLVASLGVWLAFAWAMPRQGAAARLFAAAALYLSLSLCISSSALSIKTAALLWFALGALCSNAAGRALSVASRCGSPGGNQRTFAHGAAA